MVRLLNLPDELLVAIIDYVQTGDSITSFMLNTSTAYQKRELIRRVNGKPPPQRVKDMLSLLLVSRRFHRMSRPIFYRDICVRLNATREEHLSRTLEEDPSLEARIRSVTVSCRHERILNFVHRFFWLPRIETLTILAFGDQKHLKLENDSRIGTSPVKALNLRFCTAHMDALADVLSWPARLEVFHYHGGAASRFTQDPRDEWTYSDFGRTLQPLKTTLRNLTIPERPKNSEEYYLQSEPCIDLRDFTALTTLRIYEVYDPTEVLRVLPPSLEVLEISHDTERAVRQEGVVLELEEVARDTIEPFLFGMLRYKHAHVPCLLSVRIISDEISWPEEGLDDPEDWDPWTPPSSLVQQYEEAGVKLRVRIGVLTYWAFL